MKNEKVWFEPLDKWDILFEDSRIKHSAESVEHLEKKKEIALEYISEGYEVGIEVGVNLGYIVDVVAVSDDEMVAVEVGLTDTGKLDELNSVFSIVNHVGYTDDDGKVVKKAKKARGDNHRYAYLIPTLGGEIAYSSSIGPPPLWEKKVDGWLVYVTNFHIPHFHKSSVNVGVEEYPENADIEEIKQDLGIPEAE